MRTATITKIKGLLIQTQQNTFVLFTLFKLTLDERKTLTKILTCKPLTTVPQTSAHLRRQLKCKQQVIQKRAVCIVRGKTSIAHLAAKVLLLECVTIGLQLRKHATRCSQVVVWLVWF